MLTIRYEELFQENVVMTMEHLKLETSRPRESILRDLKNIGYYSSYNQRGKYYALEGTPEFNDLGLWNYRDAYFSAKRTLLDTAEHLVTTSDAGHTHDELRQILGIGVQNSLYQLTVANRLARRQVGAQYVYFGMENIGRQWEKRSTMPVGGAGRKPVRIAGAKSRPDIAPELVVDVLVAVLRGHDTEPDAHSYLNRTGSPVTAHHVTAVFRHYGIGKKTLRL
jgi:hypothetical protein